MYKGWDINGSLRVLRILVIILQIQRDQNLQKLQNLNIFQILIVLKFIFIQIKSNQMKIYPRLF